MDLPVLPPVSPMLAKSVSGIPRADGLVYEPKYDGFRCIVFRDGDEVVLGSRNERPLTRYFPEVVEALKENLPPRCVLDGEIVLIDDNGNLDFDGLQQRIHPAESRVRLLSENTPGSFVAFDLLALGDDDWRDRPFGERHGALHEALVAAKPPIYVTPSTTDPDTATMWFDQFEGAGLDGVIAKPASGTYQENKRTMFKVKHERTADCVVAGFRWHKTGDVIGSLLLGLYDDEGFLHHTGITASFTMVRRRELVGELEPYRMDSLAGHPWEAWGAMAEASGEGAKRKPGAVSRWNAKKDLSWEPLRPELVVEVGFAHMQGDRFRHATTFRNWRPDRTPESCTYAQLDVATPADVRKLFAS
jgi:ATP-dependent DNA ligase